MKFLLYVVSVFFLLKTYAQTDVFDCANFYLPVAPSQIDNANPEFFATCINLTNAFDYNLYGDEPKILSAVNQIHIETGTNNNSSNDNNQFRAGSYNSEGRLHLKINAEAPTFPVYVMNYPDLNTIVKYDKLELGIVLPADIQTRINSFVYNNGNATDELNPYLEWETQVYCTFKHVSNTWSQDVQGFFSQEFDRNLSTDAWDLKPGQENATDYPAFRVRFAPPLVGYWLAQVHVKVNGVEVDTSPFFGFNVIDTGRAGFVKVHGNKKNLERDGKIIFPVGACLPYAGEESAHFEYNPDINRSKKVSDYEDYNQQLLDFAQLGGKYTRVFFDAYCGNIEWNKLGDYTEGLKYVHEMDAVFEIFRQHDMLADFTLMMHDPIADFTDYFKTNWDFGSYNWASSNPETAPYCYTSINGVNSPVDMLTNWQSIKYIKQRYRYMISRYGYSTNIYVYNLLSEPWHINQSLKPSTIAEIEAWKNTHPNYQYTDIAAAFEHNLYEGNIIVPYDDYLGSAGNDERAAIQFFHTEIAAFIKNDLSRRGINLLGAIGHMPVVNDVTSPDGTGFDDDSWSLQDIDVIGISAYDQSPKYMYKSDDNNYGKTFKKIFEAFQKPILLVETDHSDGTDICTFNEQAVMVMNRVGTSGCAGFNIWRTYGPYASEQDELVRVANFMNSDLVINTLSEGDGNWEHQASVWEINVSSELNGVNSAKNVGLRELQFVSSQDKSKGYGSIYNRQFNVQNHANYFLDDGQFDSLQYSPCHLGFVSFNPYSFGDYAEDGYMFLEGWVPKYIKWNKKKKLKVLGLKSNTDYRVKYYDYNTYSIRDSAIQNSSGNGKLKIKHPKLAWNVQDNYQPIYTFTVEEIVSGKSSQTMELDKIGDLSNDRPVIYPNPSNGNFSIESIEPIFSIDIFSLSGDLINSNYYKDKRNFVNVEGLLKGMYIIVINKTQHFKLIIV